MRKGSHLISKNFSPPFAKSGLAIYLISLAETKMAIMHFIVRFQKSNEASFIYLFIIWFEIWQF